MKDVGGAVLAGSSSQFRGRERAAVDVDVGPERRSPRYHEACLALESVKESSAAVSKPRCVWLRVPIFKDLEKARRLPVRVEEQQAQQLAMNPPRSAGDVSHDGRQEIQLTAMVPIELPVLGNLACRLLVKIPVDVCVLLNGKSRKRGPKGVTNLGTLDLVFLFFSSPSRVGQVQGGTSMHAASTPHELSPPASLTSKLVRMPECQRSENRRYIGISAVLSLSF